MKLKPLVIFACFFIISFFGIFSTFSDAKAGTATGDCNCFTTPTCADTGCITLDEKCTSDAACTTACKSYVQRLRDAGETSVDPNETTGDCWGVSAPTPSDESLRCESVNPECTAAWDGGERKSRFISSRNCYCCGDCGFDDIVGIFINAADYLFGILGALALVFFIYGGLVWLTSGGSSTQIDKGKKIILGALIGILLALGAWLIVQFLITALGVTTNVTGFTNT